MEAEEPDVPSEPPVVRKPAMILPVAPAAVARENPDRVRWRPLVAQSVRFLLVEQGFRLATEPATRHPRLSFFRGYAESVNGLHGWGDGDPFVVNYVGHPMEGSVAGFLWIQNDGRYGHTEFGRDPAYWRGRLRAAGYAWVYSTLFEIGPLSEATIGHTQAFFPQQGFADHVVTPTVGLGWTIAEDAMDKYLVRWIESRTDNQVARLLARGGLNPSRAVANLLAGEYPWHREDRPLAVARELARSIGSENAPGEIQDPPETAPFELTAGSRVWVPLNGEGPCLGGGATAAFRMPHGMQWLFDMGGCRQLGLRPNLSGDNLTVLTGPRWSVSPMGGWNPYVQVLFGGVKATTEETFPGEKKALAEELARVGQRLGIADHPKYTAQADTAGFAISVGAGIEKKLNRALALRVASVDYTHAFLSPLEGTGARSSLQLGAGLVLRMGMW